MAEYLKLKKLNLYFEKNKAKNTIYTILIICEGTNSEPNYFKGIKEHIINDNIWPEGVSIDIRPKPPLEKEMDGIDNFSNHKTRRKKRKLKANHIQIADIEDRFKSVPVRYVREAQIGLEDSTYNEVWAVFDKDYHPKTKEAFELADEVINGKQVNIAFSSISFEHWVLLHFEKNNSAFQRSECKDDQKRTINCGTQSNINDCQGKNCVAGYIKTKKYLTKYSKNAQINLYALLSGHTLKAIENTSWIKHKISGSPVYTLNPYSTVDILVKRLLKLDDIFYWTDLNFPVLVNKLSIILSIVNKNTVNFSVTNTKAISQVFRINISFQKEEVEIRSEYFNGGVVAPQQSIKFNFLLQDITAIDTVKITLDNKTQLSIDMLHHIK